ncbi:hypothetical protein ISM_07640 [Roseovarius nubinhibens ISM]|uniref:Uncharacterized protein n=1 Tax=Roseovarius nubinhibens (strain ATCC BAA-591 / DSM 15170 / ISM) TaxID=89187 RepID=A3SLC0_ROSNI|nr:hypothetical protein ISM_07640 [Roseovarius nubinhibens ISM]
MNVLSGNLEVDLVPVMIIMLARR